jgi:tellurite resistance protein TerC
MVFARLKIERSKQEMILLFGIGLSLVLRAIFLLSGAVLVEKWSFMFFLFGAFLIYTAIQVARDDGDEEWKENKLITFFKSKSLSVTSIAFISIALADIMFAVDSIPAIIGITTDTYVIITSNFFALMGLRQLYFLVEKLMVKLVYLSFGLAFILFFIGFKLIFEALISYDIHRVLSFDIPEITTKQSLLVIVLTLAVTTLFSLLKKQKPNYPL